MKQERKCQPLASVQPATDFAWSRCVNQHSGTRVAIKQQAVDDAFSQARKLRDELQEATRHVNSSHAAAFDLMGGDEIRAWVEEMIALERKNENLEILVGVAGTTGAGKTSLLNALLEYPELLPSSSTEAATATVCRIAWNYDNTEGHEFRADVKFRSKEAVVKELNDVLAAVKDRKNLRERPFEDDDEHIQAIEEIADIISKSIRKVCTVWNLDENELEDKDYTTGSILEHNEQILNLLGKETAIYSADLDNFATEVKPYLDSTPTLDGIIAWPLIEEVRIYVKSEILRHGIVLVDLPGLSDMIEDRSAIAEGYYQNLSVTAIVAPAIRAVDEKTGVKLMNNYQELRMQLDGKYNKNSFCVIVSKIDDIDCDAFCKGFREAQQNAQLQTEALKIQSVLDRSNQTHQELKTLDRKLKNMRRKSASLKKKIDSLKGDAKKRRKAAQIRFKRSALVKRKAKQLSQRKNLSNLAIQLDLELAALESRRKFCCIGIRNDYIKKRIRTDFARRQRELTRLSAYDKERYDGSVNVFPICAVAFRDLLKNKKPMSGFPSKLYTGVPRLRQWLGEAVYMYREEHLDSVLRGLQRLYDGLMSWSDDNSRGKVKFSRGGIKDLLQKCHDKYDDNLEAALAHISNEIKTLNPFRNKNQKLASSKPLAIQAASRWVYKYPEDPNSNRKMPWMTYQAILKARGGPFQSYGEGRPLYDFPLALGIPFLNTLREDWVEFFLIKLPKTENPLVARASEIWGQYLEDIHSTIHETAPEILPYLEAIHPNLQNILCELCESISSTIKSVSKCASRIHPLFIASLRSGLAPIFYQALEIKGKGHFLARQAYIRAALADKSNALFSAGYARMQAAYRRRVRSLPGTLQLLARAAVRCVRIQISLWLNNVQAHARTSRSDRAAMYEKVRLQKRVKAGMLAWTAVWRVPTEISRASSVGENAGEGKAEGGLDGGSLEIPKEYVEVLGSLDI